MSKELIVSASSQETKAVILEGGEVVEIHIEREGDQGIVGSICKGRVTKVLPGMQSAFVNVGLERDAFLYVSDFFEDTDEYDLIGSTADEQGAKLDQNPGPETARQPTPAGEDSGSPRYPDRRMRPRRARRGRLRGKRQEAAPSESGAAPPAAAPPANPAPSPPPVPVSGPPEALSILPGESLAKYSGVSEPPPPAEPEPAPEGAVQSEPIATAETSAIAESAAQSEPAAAEETAVQAEPSTEVEPTAATVHESPPLKGRRGRRRSRQAAAESAQAASSAASPEEAQATDTPAAVHADGDAATAETAAVEEPTAQAEEASAEAATAEAEETTAEAAPSSGDSEPAADSVTVMAEPEAATEETPPSPAQAESATEDVEAAREMEAQAPPEPGAAEQTESAGEPTPEVAEPAAEAAADESGDAVATTDDDAGEQVQAAEGSTAVDSPEEPAAVSTETDQAREPAPAEVAESTDSPAGEPAASAAEGASDPSRPEDPGAPGEAAGDPEPETVGAADAPAGRTSGPRTSNAQYRSRPNTPRFFRRSPDRRRSQYRGEDRQRREAASPAPMIADLLKEGQEILVQIAKEPLGTKGARITSHIAIPGRYLVYMPTVNHIGVSRKISSGEERQRLRKIIQDNRGDLPGGFIVRTAGEYKGEDEFKADIGFLRALWTEVKTQSDKKSAPAIIHRELNLVQRILRDQFNREFSAIRVDSELAYASIVELIHRFQPSLVKKVKLYTRETPIFEEFGVQAELDKALRSKVWLKSGGYIVIDQAEALVAIDVNTGKYVGKSNKLEDTIAKTNMEAAREIARQLRLRDLGGIIVCDFIDMEDRKNRLKVTQTLETALRKDKSPSKVLQFNDFGLVAITRKRVKQSLLKLLCEPCSQCCGSGMVKSPRTVCYEIRGEARKMAGAIEDAEITFRVNPAVAKALKTTESSVVDELEASLKKDVVIKSDPLFPQERFDIF